jgi:hypothetical protein
MPFTNAHHGGDADRAVDAKLGLAERIDAELRSRLEDAADYACLDAMVRARRARGARAPAADDPRDRDEYTRRVQELLERVRTALVDALSPEQCTRLGTAIAAPRDGDLRAALDAQVALAKELPDYWQRFDEIRRRDDEAPASGGERRSLLDRLLGR